MTVAAFEAGQRGARSPASRSARASRARSSGTTSRAALVRTARTTCARRARSARRPRPHASSRGSRWPASRRGRGRDGHGRELRAGRRGQGRRDRDRQGLPGHDQAPQLLERPAVARLAQHPQAGLDRRLGDAVARLQGHEDGRPDGRQARHPGRPDGARGRRRAEPAARQGLRSRARRTGSSRCAARWLRRRHRCSTPPARRRRTSTLEDGVFAVEVKPHLVHEAVRAEQNAHRAGTFATKSRGLVSGGRAKPWRQKGTGRARQGTIRAPQFEGGGHAFAKVPRTFVQKVNRKAAKAALRSALASHVAGGLARARRRDRVRRSRRRRPREASSRRRPRRLRRARAERRRDERRQVVPQPPARRDRRAVRARGERRRLGALARRLARPRCRSSRARAELMDASQIILAPVVSEKSYAGTRRRQVHVPRPPGRAQDPDPPGDRGALRGQRRAREHRQGAAEAEAPRHDQGHEAGLEEGDRAARGPARRSSSSKERSSRCRSAASSRPRPAAAS